MAFAPLAIPIMMGITAAISAGGAVMQGVAASNQAAAQAKVARQQALYARQSAAADEKEFRDDQSRNLATRRALLGGTGVDPGSGSPLLATQDFASEVELQALKIRQGGEVQATRLEQQARLNRMAGQSEQIGGFMRGGSLLLTGATDAWSGYSKLNGG